MMQFKKEVCRNFQRGSCRYGDRCKYLHATPQQQQQQQRQRQQSNPFGFGTQPNQQQQQQHKPNPFGFGVQIKPSNDFANKQQQFKPFENKWTRFSPIPANDNQPLPANHNCTDPDSCNRLISEDFQNERPLWKLTCYGHWKNSPCDIVGDISYEELRAVAYDDAKRGLGLQSIVERERNLLNSKLIEFDNLLRNPYRGPSNSALPNQSPFPGTTPNAFSPTAQNNAPPPVSSFKQLGTSLNAGFGIRSSTPSNNAFGQPNSFPNSSQIPGAFGTNNFPSANAGSFGSQLPTQPFGSSFNRNSGVISVTSAVSTQNPSSSSNQSPTLSNGLISSPNAVGQATMNIHSVENFQREAVAGDVSIWLKEKWMPGEIPEEAPSDAFV